MNLMRKHPVFPHQTNKSLFASFSSEKEDSFFPRGGEGPAEAEACIGLLRWGPQHRGAAFGPVIEAFGASCLLQTLNSVLGPWHRASRRSRAVHAWIDFIQSPAPRRRV
jgi:hypothetical protein